MKVGFGRRLGVLAVFLLAIGIFAGAVWRYGYVQALDQVALRGEADLALAADRLSGQLQLFQQMAVLMVDHPQIVAVLAGDAGGSIQPLLRAAADKTAALDVMVVDANGQVMAAASGAGPYDISTTPHFIRAQQGAMGEHHGVSEIGGQRAYYFAAPGFDTAGQMNGALIVIANIEKVEAEWRGARPAVYFTDEAGEVFITNRSELLFWRRTPGGVGLVPPGGGDAPLTTTRVGAHEIWRENWSGYVPARALHLTRDLPAIGMRAEALLDIDPARGLAWLQAAVVAAVCLAFGAMLFLATERRRTLALANALLEGRVSERTAELSMANLQLRREVSEREEAEAALKQAQADLVQAGKLSALGQMSAGISHELNQPLMAIQQYSENGEKFLARGKVASAADNMARISQLARRMARIIKNLRAFARQESEPMAQVDLVAVIDAALELTGPGLRRAKIKLVWRAPEVAIWVRGGEVRLGQVMVNLISNASDAMMDSAVKRLEIKVLQGDRITVKVRDTGPGIAAPEKIFDPFYSTKAVGASEGMGLGLSISYGLVQSFGGAIKGQNAPEGGAVFTVELERWIAEQAA